MTRAAPYRAPRAAAAVLAFGLACATVAGATGDPAGRPASACVPVAGGGELTVAGVGRALFAALATDRARDAARLSGGVCVELTAIGGVLRSDRVELTDLSGAVRLAADDVVIALPGWTLRAGRLQADAGGAELADVFLEGSEAIARAATAVVDLDTGAVEATAVRLLTEALWIDAAQARIVGPDLTVAHAWLTTCDCPPGEADLRIEARTAAIDLLAMAVVLDAAELVTGRWRWPLPDPWTVSADAFADLRPPWSLAVDPEGRRGAIVSFDERELGVGARWAWEAATGAGDRPPDLGVRLNAAAGGASVAFVGASDRLSLRWRVERPLAGGWAVAWSQRLEGGAVREPVRDQRLEAAWSGGLAGLPGVADLGATAFVAASAQTRAAGEVVGARLGVEGRLRWAPPAAAGWRGAIELSGGATAYPATLGVGAEPQSHVSIAPTLVGEAGGWRVSLAHLSRWVAGASPFGVTLDRVDAAHRSDLRVDAGIGSAAWDAFLAARWDWRADPLREGRAVGWERVDVGATGTVPLGIGDLVLRVDAALAGVLDPRAERRAEIGARAAWTHGDWEIGGRVRSVLAPAPDPWRAVTLFGAAPIVTGDWSWRPYLEVDLAASARRNALVIVGHGLDLTWRGPYATVELGYRHDDEAGTSVRAGLRVEPHDLDPARLAARADDAARAALRDAR